MGWLMIVVSVLIPNIGGIVGGLMTAKSIKNWYNKELKKPEWRPPNWVFGPMWTSLYSTMGYAAYRVWLEYDSPSILIPWQLPWPLKLFALQLLLNWLWTPIFFGLKNITLALLEIILLDVAVVATGWAFYQEDDLAGTLFIPYMLWLTLATALTLAIWKMNPRWRNGVPSKET
ncbi:translocator protein isoform X2 [Penaeus vannamei]|uniref:Putative translocator protein n=2 Tax=Penaeus vannamei TaxID=6689 RepID=A0A423SGZ3_PENVA|nr:translocator protein-like [Penaeus vannamei]ROT63444.1 putative translocator protein [Penaeus vannamei]